MLYLDYTAPVDSIRARASEIVRADKRWDGQVFAVQITDSKEATIELRIIASARTSPEAFDLRCDIREKVIAFIQREYPQALPRQRGEWRAIEPPAVYARAGERAGDGEAQRSRAGAGAR